MGKNIKIFLDRFLSFIYPPKCYVCKNIIEEGNPIRFCRHCEGSIEMIKMPVCEKCGAHIDDDKQSYCHECRLDLNRNKFKRNYSVMVYDDIVRDIIHNFKYFDRKDYAEGLVELAFKKTNINFMEKNINIIIPVPLHKDRLKERGFNQAEVIAKLISSKTNIPMHNDILIRIRSTQKQSLSNYHQRQANMKGAFKVINESKIRGLSVMLVDDIYTTGSTLSECAAALFDMGAVNVISFTIAKTIKKLDADSK